ncbi:MAG: helix-turn-helix transcriptional regulator [Bacteroidota bacterium]
MDYRTYTPDDTLLPFVKCFWTLEIPEEEELKRQTIVPDGCVEMIFHYGDAYKQYLSNGQSLLQPKCFVIGQLTQPLEIEPTGATGIFSVRFHPEGFMPFSTTPIKQLENNAVPLDQLFGAQGLELEKTVLKSPTTEDRIFQVAQFLSKQLQSSATIDRIVKQTVCVILSADDRLSINTLTKEHQINRRSLERKFAANIGLSPKLLHKTLRLQTSLKRLFDGNFTSLTALAYDGGYYDQAHFIRDFKEFTGFTPKEFYGKHLAMSSLFYGSE